MFSTASRSSIVHIAIMECIAGRNEIKKYRIQRHLNKKHPTELNRNTFDLLSQYWCTCYSLASLSLTPRPVCNTLTMSSIFCFQLRQCAFKYIKRSQSLLVPTESSKSLSFEHYCTHRPEKVLVSSFAHRKHSSNCRVLLLLVLLRRLF